MHCAVYVSKGKCPSQGALLHKSRMLHGRKKCLGESSPPSVFFLLAKKSLIFTTPPPPPPPHRTRTRPAISTWQQHMPRPRERERKIRVPFSLRQISPFARSFVLRGYMTTLFSLSALFLRKIDLKGDEESLVSLLLTETATTKPFIIDPSIWESTKC